MRARRGSVLAAPCALLLVALSCGRERTALGPAAASGGVAAGEAGSGAGENSLAGATSGAPALGSGGVAGIDAPAGAAGEDASAGSGGTEDCGEQPVRALSLRAVHVLQGVDVPIMERLVALDDRRTDLVRGRAALLRAFVMPAPEWQARSIRGRLTLVEQSGTPLVLEQTVAVAAASNEDELDSTLNFVLPGAAIRDSTSYSLELFETTSCGAPGAVEGARFPERGVTPLGAVRVGPLHVRVVPVKIPGDGGSLLPDTTPERLESLRAAVMRLFPIEGIELSLREQPLASEATDMLGILDDVAALRDAENDDPRLTYYGLVRFVDGLSDYCAPSCVLGASFTGETPSGGVAVGVGYADEATNTAFAHELGHVYGRMHSPCNVAGDPDFPYGGGSIGSMGYDLLEGTLVDPRQHFDFMGYCSPSWVSDYVYQGLLDFIATLNAASPAGPTSRQLDVPGEYRSLILPNGRPPRWGRLREARRPPDGVREVASVLDAGGRVLEHRVVRRFKVADLDAEIVYLPAKLASNAVFLRLAGRSDVPFPIERRP